MARKGLRFVGDVRTQSRDTQSADAATRQIDASAGLRPAASQPERPTIAVLPFTNMSGDPEQEYFSDGISEDIITALSKLRWFFVIARNSSFIYKGKSVHLKQIGEELGVAYVVEGSVHKNGERVRITVQLNDVATGSHIWAKRTTGIPPTFSPCRTRSRRRSSRRSSRSSMRRKAFAPSASRRTVSMRGISSCGLCRIIGA